jgi:5'-nucleotidase
MTHILLTNDDGIESYGLWAAAEALSALGNVTVVAPQEQWSGAGRGLPQHTTGVVRKIQREYGGKEQTAFAVDASPAQAVLYALLEILPQPPDLVVAGINYGENMGTGITISGTVGAVLEAAAAGLPAMAISQQTPVENHLNNSAQVDFATTSFFAGFFAGRILAGDFRFPDVAAIKVDVPSGASRSTPWKITRVSCQRYYIPSRPLRDHLTERTRIPYTLEFDSRLEKDSDLYALHMEHLVSVTPLSLDLTARVDLVEMERRLRTAE